MVYKKVFLTLLIGISNSFLTHAIDPVEGQEILTPDEVKALIKTIEQDPELAKRINPNLQSEKALK